MLEYSSLLSLFHTSLLDGIQPLLRLWRRGGLHADVSRLRWVLGVSFQTAFLWRMKATSLFTFRCLVKRWNVIYCSILIDYRSVITLFRYLIQVLCCDCNYCVNGMYVKSILGTYIRSARCFLYPGVSCPEFPPRKRFRYGSSRACTKIVYHAVIHVTCDLLCNRNYH